MRDRHDKALFQLSFMRFALTAILTCALFSHARADSVIDGTLASVDEVQIVVQTAALSYNPIPQLDLPLLEQNAATEITTILARHGIERRTAAPVSLVVKLSQLSVSTRPGTVVVKVVMLLREPALLEREQERMNTVPAVVTSWDSWRWTVIEFDEVPEAILTSIRSLATELGETVSRARDMNTERPRDVKHDDCRQPIVKRRH